MKLKFIITIFLAIILSEFSIANFYKKGDTLHVWATSGLNIREGSGTDFPKMKKLEYGDEVQVIDDYLRSTPLNITVVKKSKNSDAFVMKGHWVRVIIGTQEGYVFDGYLSRLPVLKRIENKTNMGKFKFEPPTVYFQREFGLVEKIEKRNELNVGITTFEFNQDITIKQITKIKGADATIKIPSITFNEGYLFFNVYSGFEDFLNKKEKPKFIPYNISENKHGIFMSSMKHGDVYISIIKGVVVIKKSYYC